MKFTRLIWPFVLFALLFSACSDEMPAETSAPYSETDATCTSSPPESAFGEKYDFIPALFACSQSREASILCKIKGGALVKQNSWMFYDDTSVFTSADGSNQYDWIGLYDEDSNSLVPLCFNPACEHNANKDSDKCFAQMFYGKAGAVFGVSSGEIFIISNDISCSYYSFDGSLKSTVNAPADIWEQYWIHPRDFTFCEGRFVYVIASPMDEDKNAPATKILLRYSIDDRAFSEICRISLEASCYITISRKVNGVYYCLGENSVYTMDINTGEYRLLRDWAEAYLAIAVFSGKTEFDEVCFSREFDKVSVRWLSEDYKTTLYYTYDFLSGTVCESSEEHSVFQQIGRQYLSYRGHTVVSSKSSLPGEAVFSLTDIDTGEVFDIPYSCGDAERRFYGETIRTETENGFIFKAYLRKNERADPGRLVWISKEDYFSGNWGNYKEINMIY